MTLPDGAGLFALASYQGALRDLLGTPVDVVPDNSVKPRLRDSIYKDAIPL